MNDQSEQIKEFAREIAEKLYDKLRDKGGIVYSSAVGDMVRQMVIHKMIKENWMKQLEEKKD